MRVLWFTYDFPYPLTSGGKIRAYHLIKGVSKNHQIDLFSFIRSKNQLQYLSELKKYCRRVETFKRPYAWSPRNILLCGFSSLPFAATTYYFSGAKRKIRQMTKDGNYDLIHFESFYPAVYLPQAKNLGVRTLMGNENVEYEVYERYAKQRIFPLNFLLALDVLKMKKFEENLWKKATFNIAPSKDDAKVISKVTGKPCSIVPNGVDVEFFSCQPPTSNPRPTRFATRSGWVKPQTSHDSTMLFVGNLKYMANQNAVRWLIEKIWPGLKPQAPSIKLLIVGKNPPRWLKGLESEDIIVDDSVEDIRDAYARADVFLAPIRIGGGTRLKILEAMAAGLPVVSTTIGAEGITVKDNENILIADEPQDFAQKVVTLLKNPTLRDKIGKNGRSLVQEKYDWKQSVRALEKVYEKLGV